MLTVVYTPQMSPPQAGRPVLHRIRLLASDSVVYGLSGIIARFLSAWLVPVYTRLFTPADYGVMSLITSTTTLLGIFVVLALDNSAARWYWDTEDSDQRRRSIASGAWGQFAAASLAGLALFVLADQVANRVIRVPDAGKYFRLCALTLPLNQFVVVSVNWLRMRRRPVATTVFTLGVALGQIGLTLLFVVGFRWGLTGVYRAQVLTLAGAAMTAIALMRDWLNPRHFRMTRLREMLRFALPLIPTAIAVWVVSFADRYFIQRYSGVVEVGLYGVGYALAQVLALLTGAFQQAWGPFALSIHTEPDARQTYANVFLVYVTVTAIAATGLSLFAPEAIRIVATDRYAGASTVVGLLSLSYVVIGLTYIAAIGPTIMKTNRDIGIALTVAALLNVVLNLVFVPRYGKIGSAAATLISQSLTPIYLFTRAQKLYPIPYRFGSGIALLAAAVAIIAAGTLLPTHRPLLTIAAKIGLVLLFVPLLLYLRLIPFEGWRALFPSMRVSTPP